MTVGKVGLRDHHLAVSRRMTWLSIDEVGSWVMCIVPWWWLNVGLMSMSTRFEGVW